MKSILLLVIVSVFGSVLAQDQFQAYVKKCNSEFSYRVIRPQSIKPNTFYVYKNTTASSEADCARRCFERTDFCQAAEYRQRERLCIFSYKFIDCADGDESDKQRSFGSTAPRILHCMKCRFLEKSQLPVNGNDFVRKPTPSSRRIAPIVRQPQSTRSRSSNTRRTSRPLSRSRTTKRFTTVAPVVVTRQPVALKQLTTPRALNEREVNAINLERAQKGKSILANVSNTNHFGQQCSSEMRKPCEQGFGRGCNLVQHSSGCHVCSCPYKSASRGCAGPQGLTDEHRANMLMGRDPCPNGEHMQTVHRWYRRKSNGIDRCVLIKEPYCGWLQDVNIWRMPRTQDECHYFCYSDDELRTRGNHFLRI